MPFRSPFRLLIYVLAALAIAAVLRHHQSGGPEPATVTDSVAEPAPVRVARDDQPTIVEPNENWLEAHHDSAEPGSLPDSHATVLIPADNPAPTAGSLNR